MNEEMLGWGSKKAQEKDLVRTTSSMREGPVVQGKDGYYRVLHAKDWGKILIPSNNPEGVEITEAQFDEIQLNPDFPRIPGELWSHYIELCFFMCPDGRKLNSKFHDSQLEVQVCLLRDMETRTKWKIVVPKQTVSGVSVKSELAENIDIVTGEKYHQFPPPGWVHAGSSHSHNTMDAFFSSVDDKSELTVPGLHIVVGAINHTTGCYRYEASVVLRKSRKEVEFKKVVDDSKMSQLDFHPDVIDYIDTVVSANRKLYKKENEKKKDEEVATTGNKPGEMELLDEDGKIAPFLFSLDESNSDLFDENSYFPYDDDIETLVSHCLDTGYSFNDIVMSLVRAKRKYEKDESEDKPFITSWTTEKD